MLSYHRETLENQIWEKMFHNRADVTRETMVLEI